MTFSAIRNREIQKIFKDKIATLGFDETQSPERSEQSKAAILRMANEAIGEIVKPLSMDTIRDLARNVESTDKFLNSIKEYLVNNIKFTPEYADTIVKNTFGGQETYLYNLYKNTEKQAFVRIDSNGKVEFSKDKEEPFLDANGNNTHLYRINGLGEDLIKKSNAVIVDKFMKDGKEDDLTRLSKDERTTLKTKAEELGKKVKDFSTEDIINAKLNKYIATMEKKGYEYVGSFQEEGKKHIFVPKEFGVDRFIAETFGSRVEDINKLEPKYIAIVGDNASKRGKLPFWGEITPDTESLRKNRPNRQDDNIRVLYFDDKGVIDGSDFAFQHYANTLNDTISAGEANNTWKTVSSGDKGNFIKSQTELLTAEHLSDPIFQEALTRYAEKNQEEVEGTTLKEMIDGGAFETVDGRKAIKALIEK